jgi:DNA repair exonuclease SbcCD ATPase subunit
MPFQSRHYNLATEIDAADTLNEATERKEDELNQKNEILKAIMQAANLDIDIAQIHLVEGFILKALAEKLQISDKLEKLTKEYAELKSSYEQVKSSLDESQANHQTCQEELLLGKINHKDELEL